MMKLFLLFLVSMIMECGCVVQAQSLHRRDDLANAYLKFTKEKKGCVAFLGGSITEMEGWRNMMKDSLQSRFPDTKFHFIDAGLPSAGSTPHAFRFANDVLQHGMPDLLFVEAAVNDDANHFSPIEQIRGMEGIIRHARRENPYMDIIMLHFIYEPFIPLLDKGIEPEVITNHEKVATHYGVTSINLAEEIAKRMREGEFDWHYFGGVHPKPEGHRYYAASIGRLFAAEWDHGVKRKKAKAHRSPHSPLDPYVYDRGELVDITSAKSVNGWRVVQDWTPSHKGSVREGFVHVPMLEALTPQAELTLDFEGRAIGIFCVAGPQAATLEYTIDGAPAQRINTYTEWSSWLYIPWVYMLAPTLPEGKHTLRLRVAEGEKTACQIRNFVVNR